MEDDVDVDVDVKRMCVLSGQGLVGLVSNAWGRLRQGRRDETRQDELWGTDFLCCRCYKAHNGRQGKARQGARCKVPAAANPVVR